MSDEAAMPAPADAGDGAPVRGARKRKTVEFYKPPMESGKTAGTDSAVKEVGPDHIVALLTTLSGTPSGAATTLDFASALQSGLVNALKNWMSCCAASVTAARMTR